MEYIYIVLTVLVVFTTLYLVINKLAYKQRIQNIKDIIARNLPEIVYKLEDGKGKKYDLALIINDKRYLFKVLVAPSGKELVITNKNTWIVYENHKLSIKNQILSIKNFMDIPLDTNMEKIVIIYPHIYRLLKYINENEMVLVSSNTKVYDALVINYHGLDDYIEKLTKK